MTNKPKVVVWDLEFCGTQNYRGELRAFPGYIMAFSWKEVGKRRVNCVSLLDFPGEDPTDDSKLIPEIAKVLADVDMHVYHYGTKCDLPFLRTRLMKHGYELLPGKQNEFDTCSVARKYLSLKRNSLSLVAEFFGLKESKMVVSGETWLKANAGVKSALRTIISRCKSDVRLTEEVYEKLKPLVPNHPALQKLANLKNRELLEKPGECNNESCPSPRGGFKSKGYMWSGQTLKQRWRCKACGCEYHVTVPKIKHKEAA